MQERKLTVFFKGDAFDRVEGDEMPTEAEFVASLGSKRAKAKVPELEATEPSWPASPGCAPGRAGRQPRASAAFELPAARILHPLTVPPTRAAGMPACTGGCGGACLSLLLP